MTAHIQLICTNQHNALHLTDCICSIEVLYKNVMMCCICKQVAIKYVDKSRHGTVITIVSKLNLLLRYCREAISQKYIFF